MNSARTLLSTPPARSPLTYSLCALALAATVLACHDLGEPAGDAPASATGAAMTDLVATTFGPVRGTSQAVGDTVVRSFNGIPYAAPPVGELRWRAPQPPTPWSETRDAIDWAYRCPQGSSTLDSGTEISEDCLTLNVNTPATSSEDRLPVMVFFHGGGLTIGTANSTTYNHPGLPTHGVVLVTVNSRLGPIGYMAHPALTAESENAASGNYGTLDLIASLEWIQQNIAAFGGDPGNVLIFGESGGGTKTLSVMSSPLADGLFHKAIVQSGSAMVTPERTETLEEAEEGGQKIAAKLGLEDVAALRSASWEDLVAAAADPEVGFRANLTVDGWVLPQSVHDTFTQGTQHDVPLIVGANAGERSLTADVPMLARLHGSTAESSAFVYNFSHMPTGWRSEPCVAFHGVEIPYVFGAIPDGLLSPTILYLSQRGGCTSEDPGTDELDDQVAERTMKMWSQFARTGKPSVEGLVDWPAYTEENDAYLDIGGTLEVKTGVESAYVDPET